MRIRGPELSGSNMGPQVDEASGSGRTRVRCQSLFGIGLGQPYSGGLFLGREG